MKTIVLDANELARDLLLSGLKYQLLEQLTDGPWFDVRVPAVVVEELVAIHERRAIQARVDMAALRKVWHSLGLEPPRDVPSPTFDYRAYLLGRFDERLDFSVLPWPTATHDELVRRAVTRTRPFDEKGGGYRDALIWHDVLALARDGSDVALVTSDRTFLGDDGGLAPSLAVELAPLAGSVEPRSGSVRREPRVGSRRCPPHRERNRPASRR